MKDSLIKKQKENGDIESADIYFSSITKTVINFKYMLDKYIFKKFYIAKIIGLLKDLVG